MNIKDYIPGSGQKIKDNGEVINQAEIIEQIGKDIAAINGSEIIQTITIPINGTSTPEFTIPAGYRLAAIEMPSGWDAALIAFTACSVAGGTHTVVYESGIEVQEPAAASRTITISSNALALIGIKNMKIWSGLSTARVTQTAARTLNITLVRC